jgi:protein-S-isoprenylcysteine O-methyltransferase Ste14
MRGGFVVQQVAVGGNSMHIDPWNVVFLAGFVVYFAIRGHFEKQVRGIATTESRLDAVERTLLAFTGVGCLLLPVLYLFTPWLGFADYVTKPIVPWVGVVVMVAALYTFYRAHADLGTNWSVTLEIRKDHQLVTRGIYSRIRHPMYAAIWLFSLAQALLLSNWIAGPAALVAFGALYFVRVPREERMMAQRFGESWRDYRGRTGRLIPRFANR